MWRNASECDAAGGQCAEVHCVCRLRRRAVCVCCGPRTRAHLASTVRPVAVEVFWAVEARATTATRLLRAARAGATARFCGGAAEGESGAERVSARLARPWCMHRHKVLLHLCEQAIQHHGCSKTRPAAAATKTGCSSSEPAAKGGVFLHASQLPGTRMHQCLQPKMQPLTHLECRKSHVCVVERG